MADSSASKHRHRRPGRRRLAPLAVVAGVVASAAIATSMTGTLGAFVAQITNSGDTASSGYLTMQEAGSTSTGGSGSAYVCNSNDATADGATGTNPNSANTNNTNSASCASINKYGGGTTLVPGGTVTTTFTIKNSGTVPANSFTLAPGTCTSAAYGSVSGTGSNLCNQLFLTATATVGAGTSQYVIGTPTTGVALSALASTDVLAKTGVTSIPANTTVSFTFSLNFKSTGTNTTDNSYQGLQASQPIVWTFTS